MPSKTDAAYAAGFFDGEGHISIALRRGAKKVGKSGKEYRYDRHQFYCSVSQNRVEPIKWLCDNFGGAMRFVTGKQSYDTGRYARWNWVLSSHKAYAFLQFIRPYLLVKAAEADIAIEFYETLDHTRRAKLPENVFQLREHLARRIKEERHAIKIA